MSNDTLKITGGEPEAQGNDGARKTVEHTVETVGAIIDRFANDQDPSQTLDTDQRIEAMATVLDSVARQAHNAARKVGALRAELREARESVRELTRERNEFATSLNHAIDERDRACNRIEEINTSIRDIAEALEDPMPNAGHAARDLRRVVRGEA